MNCFTIAEEEADSHDNTNSIQISSVEGTSDQSQEAWFCIRMLLIASWNVKLDKKVTPMPSMVSGKTAPAGSGSWLQRCQKETMIRWMDGGMDRCCNNKCYVDAL